jgi:glycosyltransferase involved in cell wall biosynthesis
MPRVSLVIPCYDMGRYLDEAVESALAQTYGDFEILIVDDGSTEPATVALLDGYARPKTRVLRAPHRGVCAARNLAIAEAHGELVSFFDADDKMHPEFLRRTVGALDADPGLTFASCWVRLFGDEDWEWKAEACDLTTLLHDCSVATAALARLDAVRAAGGFDETMELGHEDWDLWLTLVERGARGTIVPEVLFYYRRRAESRSTVADRGGTYLELYRQRVEKHAASYRAHLFEVLWQKEAVIGHQLRAVAEARRDGAFAAERVMRAREELRVAERDVAERLERELARARDELRGAHDELRALRASWSWRLTGPLRAAASRLKR